MASSLAQKLQNLIGVIAGDENAAAGDDLVNVLLCLYSRGCPGLDAEGRHTVEFLLRCHIDRAVERAEHTAAVCRIGIRIALYLAHMGQRIVDMAAVLCAVFILHSTRFWKSSWPPLPSASTLWFPSAMRSPEIWEPAD